MQPVVQINTAENAAECLKLMLDDILSGHDNKDSFPEAKHVKQRIRDIFFKDKFLEHCYETDDNCNLNGHQ